MFITSEEREDFLNQVAQAGRVNPAVWGQTAEGLMERMKLMPLQWFVGAIWKLPDTVMDGHGIHIPFDWSCADGSFFNAVRKQYRATADWLGYDVLGRADLADELRFTDKAYYKPFAEISVAYYKLAKETFLLSQGLWEYAGRPEMLWYLIESERCEYELKTGGFIDIPNPKGKAEAYREVKDVCDQLEDASKLELLELPEDGCLYSPIHILINEAALLARQPENHKFRLHYENFLRTLKRCHRDIERSPLQTIYLKDGELKTVGKGKRSKDKAARGKRGFGNSLGNCKDCR